MDVKPLREWRVSRGYGVRELCRLAGVNYPALLRIEQGKSRGRASTFRKLAEALGIEPLQIAEYRRLMGVDQGEEQHDAPRRG